MRWGEKLEYTAEAGPGDFIYVPPYVPVSTKPPPEGIGKKLMIDSIKKSTPQQTRSWNVC